ncbi:MAG: hypothetical protein ACKO34_02645 [Vampirovibrionales bacterium]
MMMSEERETFVLKCDRPRYDGGVEVDLERYFGRKLQPDTDALRSSYHEKKRAQLAKDHLTAYKQLHALDEYAPHMGTHPELSPEDRAFSEYLSNAPALELVEEFPEQAWNDFSGEDARLIAKQQHDKHHQEGLRETLLKGPLQIIVSLAGLATSVVALATMMLSGRKEKLFESQVMVLLRECHHMFWKGVWSLTTLPFSAAQKWRMG